MNRQVINGTFDEHIHGRMNASPGINGLIRLHIIDRFVPLGLVITTTGCCLN